MADKVYPNSQLPIRKSSELLPNIFQTEQNEKFISGVVDPLVQPGILEKTVGYIGRRYGKTYKGSDVYLDTDQTLRSRYQLEPGVVLQENQKTNNYYDYLDFKNQAKFFGNYSDRDDKLTTQEHYSWNPPIDWDKFVNYREYYWLPLGPDPVTVAGQAVGIISKYKVVTSSGSSWIFTPDSLTNNPSLTLYRGQTYQFDVNSPNEGFVIRTNYDTGSLTFDPNRAYFPGEIVLFDNQLWKAKTETSPTDGSSITIDSQDWELLDPSASPNTLNYNNGIENNGVRTGTLTFTVPYDAPDLLYYQSDVNPDRLGTFVIADIEANTFIDVENEIIGKSTYTSSNGVEFTNGQIIEFSGNVSPEKYEGTSWLVEGVGTEITLTKFEDLVPPVLTLDTPEILFDNEGFDTQPFDDARQFPAQKDYITIARNSKDLNPWSRYNRWFHKSVIEKAYEERGESFDASETLRAKRPIIEFNGNIQIFNHGTIAKTTVDYVDDYTTDIFSNIEGSAGYSVDGEFLFEGARVLVIADTDNLANNKIYEVKFINHNGNTQITLQEATDADSALNECVLVRRGTNNAGLMYHYNGSNWVKSQEKTQVNQFPLFDAFDENGVSFSDEETYPVTSFTGSKIFSYKIGNGVNDAQLGFPISYLNIDNVGDIQFEWNWDIDTFTYVENTRLTTVNLNSGYYKVDGNFDNGWTETDNSYIQPILDSTVVEEDTTEISLQTVNWNNLTDSAIINFYLNGNKIDTSYTRAGNKFTFNRTFVKDDVVSIKVVDDIDPNEGYYEIPAGLEKNPLNQNLINFTFGQAIDHIGSAIEFNEDFQGTLPGVSNLRDINGYQNKTTRFLKHAGVSAVSFALLCNKEYNIVKSLQFAKQSYTTFKNNFLKRATEIEFEENVADFVDDIINDLTKTKTPNSAFADSDMIGSGAFTNILYEVDDVGIKTFTLTENFDLIELSRKAVYVYLNDSQLLNSVDYSFDSTFGFVTLNVDLSLGDRIEIREYVSTAYSYIPPTPTTLGLYKKYTPMKFVDDTYVEPREVIQGHDGSITVAYGDFRDDLLLELEYRIYNNIKIEYDYNIFDVDSIFGGYYENALYSKDETDAIVVREFLNWNTNTGVNYTLNSYFDSENPFTYTYSNMTGPTKTKNLPGWWRGAYQWFYDTDRPHRCPWEMLGFSEKPNWWDDEYGLPPYTRGNLILWEDLAEGIIRQGDRAGKHLRYERPTLLNHIPVDDEGNLIDPLTSGLANNFTLINNQGSFKLGDVAPSEYAWRSSSEWPYAVAIALCLLRPFDFITVSFDRSRSYSNIIGQNVDKDTNSFLKITDFKFPEVGGIQTGGLVNYVVDYVKSNGYTYETVQDSISGINIKLSARMSGFVDKEQQKYILDSKSPKSTSSGIFVPPENYDIIFNVSSPILTSTYSGIILEKTTTGWTVTGYDDINPYFEYYEVVPNQKDPLLSVGGVTEEYVTWDANQTYSNGTIALYRNDFYRCVSTHTSTGSFETNNWVKLPKLPTVGAIEAQLRKNFNRFYTRRLVYGSEFNTIQEVVDFLLGYEQYLKSVGFVFDGYDAENQVAKDWTTSCKEFMFWTKHNWAPGSIIALSPSATQIKLTVPVGVVENLLDGFYDYNVLKSNGEPLNPKFINVNRQFQTFEMTTVDTNDGIYFLKANLVLKEHVTVFDDRTVFNDVIYDKTTGYRQQRIKTQGFRTVDWDGDYTSPGFLFDNVNINAWVPFKDYRLGDIVEYKSYRWTAKLNHNGTETFVDSNWTRLDLEPEKQLVPNFDYRINQFEDYFNVEADGLGASQRDLARHSVGYQQREYLNNLAEDSVTQFRIYQGFIREKGTNNAITKVFDKLSNGTEENIIELNEEWAFKVGSFGGNSQFTESEIQVSIDNFKINPQPIIVSENIQQQFLDQYYRLTKDNFTIASIPYTTNINPVSYDAEPIKTAGYVKLDHVDHVVKTKDDLIDLDISQVSDNDHIWITFEGVEWTVLRFNRATQLIIDYIVKDGNDVTITLNRDPNLSEGDYIGIKDVTNLTGFFEVSAVSSVRTSTETIHSITVTVPEGSEDPEFDVSTVTNIYLLSEARKDSYETVDPQEVALFDTGSKLWIDNNGSDFWEVVSKNKQYTSKQIEEFGLAVPSRAGASVIYVDSLKQIISAVPGSGYVISYYETANGLGLKQILNQPEGFEQVIQGSFGNGLTVSPDERWLIVGSPLASGVRSNYQGPYDPDLSYREDDIVLLNGILWKAKGDIYPSDGSTINSYSDDWEIADVIPASSSADAPGYTQQGMITIYEYENEQWNLRESLLSPRPEELEQFGSSITVGKTGSTYYMAVSAPGSSNNTGRVYIFVNDGSGWKHLENTNYRGAYTEGRIVPEEDLVAGTAYTIVSLGNTNWNDVAGTLGVVYQEGDRIVSRLNGEELPGLPGTGTAQEEIFYPSGSIVWSNGMFWQAQSDSFGNNILPSIETNWLQLSPIATKNSLPQSIALEDDGSTLFAGISYNGQVAELVKAGDRFGNSIAMNYDASILVVGAPFSDEQFFINYKGTWRPDYEYTEGDVVQHEGGYYKLENVGFLAVADGSTIRSYNNDPSGDGEPWVALGDSTSTPTGKVFIYQLVNGSYYNLIQTISAENVINDDSANISIDSGDEFGHALALDYAGSRLVVTSPKADLNFTNQGSAYIFNTLSTTNPEYRLAQQLQSYEKYPNEYFGQSVCISKNTGKIAIGANNAIYKSPLRFDSSNTTFDDGKTKFVTFQGFVGSAYVYEIKDDIYFLAEKLGDDLTLNESFGYSIFCTDDVVVVGSPTYESIIQSGMVRLFKKDPSVDSLEIIGQQAPSVDIEKLKSLSLYDNINDVKIQDLEIIDGAKLKILGQAEQEIKFKTSYDPAVYTIGTEDNVVDSDIAWTTKHVGQLWWDLSQAKWIHYEQGDTSYRVGNWNKLAEGASIDIYEWVESELLPSEWSLLADTNEGLAVGISGQPLYNDDSVYSVKELYNTETQQITETRYYYWVKNTVIVPVGITGRRISAASVANLIENPADANTIIALIDSNKLMAYNFKNVVNTDTALINIEYYKTDLDRNNIHNEYVLVSEGTEDSMPPDRLVTKIIDSIVGFDASGSPVPDLSLPIKQRYGISFRPRQSVFVNRLSALDIVVNSVNSVLLKEPFADRINFERLNLVDEAPSSLLNLYDTSVDSYIDLETVGTTRVKQAVFSANLIDGEIDTIDIVDPGYGYKIAPPVIIQGDGTGAEATASLDNQGRISSVTVTNKGRKYSYANITVRQFSVLVNTDETANGFWGIYSWDDTRRTFYRSRSQAFDTTRYWDLIDWWAEGYSETSRIVKEILIAAEEPEINVEVGDLIRIKEYGSGGWAVFEKTSEQSTSLLNNYKLVGRKSGTIALSESLYDASLSGIGYDNIRSFDAGFYDLENANELRNILDAVRNDIFIGDYLVEWNKLFFACIRYVFTEQTYVDWAFKTSFLNASHNVGQLEQKTNYKADSLEGFRNYIDEVKPYRTTVREFVSKYDNLENALTGVSDFDLPPVYNSVEGKITPVNEFNSTINQYPWKWWLDNNGYSVVDIEISSQGEGYTLPPRVVIDGDGTGATAQAYISNGKVVGVRIITEGQDYSYTPTVTLVGGNSDSTKIAKASAVLGNSKFRTMNLTMKFDRLSKEGLYQTFNYTQTFTASGTSAVFDLNYAPTRDKSKISITKNGQIVLNSDYRISLYTSSTDSFSLLKGKLIFNQAPTAGDIVVIEYEKNDELLDSVNRIEKYYSPVSGMKGKELSQLMTGIDFGGVQIQGTTFDVTGGWDALPWFTDSWDSVEAAADYYVICDGSTNFITLPYVPADGQEITIYLKRAGEEVPATIDNLQYSESVEEPDTIRIDDPNFDENWDSSSAINPNAQMPTFVGDGSTNTVDIGIYISTNPGDTLIFRPVESDGSVIVTDPNIIDSQISGGSLANTAGAYSTATGMSAEDILIDGGKFISPDQVQSPEENVPGQVIDSLSIKVYQASNEGVSPILYKTFLATANEQTFAIGQDVLEVESVIIYKNKEKLDSTDYEVNLNTNELELSTLVEQDDVIEIISFGISGVGILDYQEFVADGTTNLYLTKARFSETQSVFVSVNGEDIETGFVNSVDFTDTPDLTMVQFATPPARNSVVKIICLSNAVDSDLVRVNEERYVADGSSRSFDVGGLVESNNGSALASTIVEINGSVLQGVDTTFATYDGTNNEFTLGLDPEEAPGAILTSNIKVYVNRELQTFIQDYVYNGTTKVLTITRELAEGDSIKIENDFRAEYTVTDNTVTIKDTVSLTEDDIVNITWFNEYPSLDMISDEYEGGKVRYDLKRAPISSSFVWVYKNGNRLTQDKDYRVSAERNAVYIDEATAENDRIKIILFGAEIYRLPSAYEIHKDMLNVYRYKRYSVNDVKLEKDLNYYDTAIQVTDASELANPIPSRNIPGIIEINKEKIEYMVKSGNTLSQLRRGTLGSAISEFSPAGTEVIDASPGEVLPYQESNERIDFVSDGSSQLIGPLAFVPSKTNVQNWYRDTIPSDHGRCDELEVFVGGTRLRKSPIEVFDESISAVSPAGDKTHEAEFSVDGSTAYIRLTETPPAGTRISIIKKTGNTWYDRGNDTATTGITLLNNDSPIAKFIAQKSTELPE